MSYRNMIGVWFILLTSFSFGFADTTKQILAKYPNQYCLITRVGQGDGVEIALRNGFNLIHSTDLSQHWYLRNRHRLYRYCSKIHIWYGDSTKMLDRVIAKIQEPITFWLNARDSSSSLNEGFGPVLQELEFIKQHPVKTHTILIDNLSGSLALTVLGNIYLHHVIEKIREINPNYNFFFEDGVLKNDILAAYIP